MAAPHVRPIVAVAPIAAQEHWTGRKRYTATYLRMLSTFPASRGVLLDRPARLLHSL